MANLFESVLGKPEATPSVTPEPKQNLFEGVLGKPEIEQSKPNLFEGILGKPTEVADVKVKFKHSIINEIQKMQQSPEVSPTPIPPPLDKKHPRTPSSSTPYSHEIDTIAKEEGVDPNLIRAMMRQESQFNPDAESPKGALGLMQLMEDTAKEVGVTDRNDPVQSIRGGARYLKKMLDRFNGDTELALAAYNAGASKVEEYGGIPPYKETRNYVKKIMKEYNNWKPTSEEIEKIRGLKLEQPVEGMSRLGAANLAVNLIAPVSIGKTLATRLLSGASIGSGLDTITSLVEEGKLPSWQRLVGSGILGAGFGGIGHIGSKLLGEGIEKTSRPLGNVIKNIPVSQVDNIVKGIPIRETGAQESFLASLMQHSNQPLHNINVPASAGVNDLIIEFPELVEMTKRLMLGQLPIIKRNLRPGLMGYFNPQTEEIIINQILGKDPIQAARTLAHEIGHVIDWLPDKDLGRGNNLGRIATLKQYFKDSIISPTGNTFKDAEIGKELWENTLTWRPFDAAAAAQIDPNYLVYRMNPVELYADGISRLFNDPAGLRVNAPQFHKAFMEFLHNKPEFKDLYEELFDRSLQGKTVQTYREGMRKMIEDDTHSFFNKLSDEELKGSTSERLRVDWLDTFDAILGRVRQTGEKAISAAENPRYALENWRHGGSESRLHMIELYTKILQPAEKAGIDRTDLAEAAIYKRVLGDRADLFNPRGTTPQRAVDALRDMEQKLGTQKFSVLMDLVDRLHDWRLPVIEKLRASRMYGDELMSHIEDTKNYVTFSVQKYLDDKYGKGVGAQIYKQYGTLDDIADPIVATALKDIAIIQAVNKQVATRSTLRFLLKNYPQEVEKAQYALRKVKDGRTVRVPIEPKNPAQGLISYMQDGHVKGFYVPKNIASAFEENPFADDVIARMLNKVAQPFRELFVNKNPGFWTLNLFRDAQAGATQLPGSGIGFLARYPKMLIPSMRMAFGIPDDVGKEMLRHNMLISIIDDSGLDSVDRDLEKMLVRYSVTPKKWENNITKPISIFFDYVERFNKGLEMLPKFAGHQYLKSRYPNLSANERAEMVRTLAGSPAFLRRGRKAAYFNSLYLFGNAIKEGFRSPYDAFKRSPAGFAMKAFGAGVVLPKGLMLAASLGLMGETWKQVMRRATEYDKANYTVIPIGMTPRGQGVYWRIPNFEPARLLGGITWKLLNGGAGKWSDIANLTAGQLPGINPAIKIAGETLEFVSGHNPWDEFRQKNIIDDTTFEANDERKWIAFLKHIGDEAGLKNFINFNSDNPYQIKEEIQELFDIPIAGRIINRFVKVTNRGLMEELESEGNIEKQENARRLLNAREAVMSYLQNGSVTPEEMQALELEPSQFKVLKRMMVYGSGDVEAIVKSSTRSNAEKALMLRRLKEIEQEETAYGEE